jgi:hypothetical protein
MRGSNEPELSITVKKELDSFIRRIEDFDSDYGHLPGADFDPQIQTLRGRFEEILGMEKG